MNKLFAITIPSNLNRDSVILYLKDTGFINFYFYFLPYSFFVRSNFSAPQIQNHLIKKYPEAEYVFIVNINRNSDFSGLVPDDMLIYFQNT